jgi:hypothetical protein
MKRYRIIYYLMPEEPNIEIVILAENYEAACVFAKEYRKNGFSIEELQEVK